MRTGFIVGCILLSGPLVAFGADEKPPIDRRLRTSTVPDVRTLLREVSEIVLKQPKEEHFWTDEVLIEIARSQIRVGDYDGALRSICGSPNSFYSDGGYLSLAVALAREGLRDRAMKVFELSRNQDHYLHDAVQSAWIEYLMGRGKFAEADRAVEQFKLDYNVPTARLKLAAAYTRAGEPAQAAKQSAGAVESAAAVKHEYVRAQILRDVAEAQRAAGAVDEAKATIRRLIDTAEVCETSAKTFALADAAVLAAKTGDARRARELFGRAIDTAVAVKKEGTSWALETFGRAQVDVGFLDDARQTAELIRNITPASGQAGAHVLIWHALAVERLARDDVAGAIRIASSMEFPYYRDDTLIAIVEHQLSKRDLESALVTAKGISTSYRRAITLLQIAAAHAAVSDRAAATAVAAQIDLTEEEKRRFAGFEEFFDYRLPHTWGYSWDDRAGIRMGPGTAEFSAEAAAAAMALSEALGGPQEEPYAEAFDLINEEKVIRSAARTHALVGDAQAALDWARIVGRDAVVTAGADWDVRRPVMRRVHALVGVAEGILDRPSKRAGHVGERRPAAPVN
jgi:tetratricopeptide (TPR) repeat protein